MTFNHINEKLWTTTLTEILRMPDTYTYTVDSKIVRALEVIRVKKFILNAVLWNKYMSSHDL